MMPIQALLRRNFSAQDVEIILGQLDKPAFVWNAAADSIPACNPLFIIFSGYSRPDLAKLEFHNLFPDIGKIKRLPIKLTTKISVASNSTAQVTLEVFELRSDSSLRLVQFEVLSPDHRPGHEMAEVESYWAMMEQLLMAPIEPKLEAALKTTLKIGQEITGCETLAVYHQMHGSESKLVMLERVGDVDFLLSLIHI